MGPVTVLSSDAHVCEPPDLRTKRIDATFRDRAPRIRCFTVVDLLFEKSQFPIES